ncbi:phosphoribosylanthranilate isomerase [Desertibacillus haloalkaliphilus]|uniref:phosphoribosylanthranilate isomerase n=1 Tax=Desertibacillus haloalkaliphilus TaxID=1328930 RepID=UPI001C263A2E|nr:phosphoribosylanthranilate isomerase [Desertibacillus haloalkaliphilus]MBU8907252.1 phosphoribosylanthranilate isomerase [Desertibacillus haloalkaliphilus]
MRPLLKYCGNHSLSDLQATLESNADFIGVVFAESKRQVTADQVVEWLKEVELSPQQQLVGLFVNPSVTEIDDVLQRVPLQVIQCHGNESKELVSSIKQTFGLPVWKVIHHHKGGLEQMKSFHGVCDGFVVDSKVKGQWGGTGETFDWSSVPPYLEEGKRQGVPVFIAGGINPNNVTKLLSFHPTGIDISSGIERDGQKDKAEISRLEERLKNNE